MTRLPAAALALLLFAAPLWAQQPRIVRDDYGTLFFDAEGRKAFRFYASQADHRYGITLYGETPADNRTIQFFRWDANWAGGVWYGRPDGPCDRAIVRYSDGAVALQWRDADGEFKLRIFGGRK